MITLDRSATFPTEETLCSITTMISSIKKMTGIVILIFALSLIVADYLYIHEFKIEGKYLIATIPLFLFDIYRRIKLNNKSIAVIVSLGLLAICVYQFTILLMLAWGYCFLGSEWPVMWFLAVITNIGLVIMTIEEIYRNTKHNIN